MQWQDLSSTSWEAGGIGGAILAAGLWLVRRLRSSSPGPNPIDRVATLLAALKRDYVAQGDIQFLESALLTARTRLAESNLERDRERTDRIAADERERLARQRIRELESLLDSSAD